MTSPLSTEPPQQRLDRLAEIIESSSDAITGKTLSGVITRAEAATDRVASNTAMMTETESDIIAARRKMKRNIQTLPGFFRRRISLF